ncbi:coproporphyrinogen III oxidase [Ceratobasidium sp. AG-Ba]|nr:coproporphyrinogen III oxidase [Ceratobasidium sp. AG-Ba]
MDLRAESCTFLDALQKTIVERLEGLDPNGAVFEKHSISASENIVNTSYVLQRTDSGRLPDDPKSAPLEKAILTMTRVKNRMPPNMPADFLKGQGARNPDVATPVGGAYFFAVNLTVFVHPRSPHAPTGHGTWRYIEILDSNENPIDWWFGGASNLTPTMLYEEDCEHFHKALEAGISKYGEDTHKPLKKWCDDYFYNPYRKASQLHSTC